MMLSDTKIAPADPPAGVTPSTGGAASEANDAAVESGQALIAQQPFFRGMNSRQLRLLAESALIKKLEPGEVIFAEGSPANRFYPILAGKVALESEMKEHGKTIPIQTLGPGDDLGWSWLFPPYFLYFSAHAVEPTRTIFFYGTRLREQCEQDHELGYQLTKRIGEVATQRLQAAQRQLTEYVDKHSHE